MHLHPNNGTDCFWLFITPKVTAIHKLWICTWTSQGCTRKHSFILFKKRKKQYTNKPSIRWLSYFYTIGNKNVITTKPIEIDKVIRLSLRLSRKTMYSSGKHTEDLGNPYGDPSWAIMCVFNSSTCLKTTRWTHESLPAVYHTQESSAIAAMGKLLLYPRVARSPWGHTTSEAMQKRNTLPSIPLHHNYTDSMSCWFSN